jgi:hypothetical protein
MYLAKSTSFVLAGTLIGVNSLAAKSLPVGTKSTHFEGFLLAKQKHTNIPTMMEPLAPPAAWFLMDEHTTDLSGELGYGLTGFGNGRIA